MTSRRSFLTGLGAALATPGLLRAETSTEAMWRGQSQGVVLGERWVNDAGETGVFAVPEGLETREVIVPPRPAGEIHVSARHNIVMWTLGGDRAIRYSAALGVEGRQFRGSAIVGRKEEWPSWRPSANMIRREPAYARYAGGVSGGLHNPLGARALYLYRSGRDTRYRIHGTSQPWTIGTNVSSGCIRLFNHGIIDLFERVPIGTRVYSY